MNKINRVTQSIIIALTTLLAAFSWAGLKNILSGSDNWLWPSIGFLILIIFLCLSLILIKSRSVLLITLLIILISFLFPFGFKIEYAPILFAALLLFSLGSFMIIKEKKVRIKINIIKTLRHGLPHILTGFALIIAAAYYFSPLAIQEQNDIEIPHKVFDIVVQPINDTFLVERVSIPEMPNSEEFTDILYNTVNLEINKRSETYKGYFSIGFAIGIFFAMKVIGIFFMWLIILISWIIFKILISLNAIKIQEESVLKEVIEV